MFSRTLSKKVVKTQKERKRPMNTHVLQPHNSGTEAPRIAEIIRHHNVLLPKSETLASFHRTRGPIPIKKITGTMIGPNTESKYGGPTEILPALRASINSGYKVPRRK